jgi:hypothetical protein
VSAIEARGEVSEVGRRQREQRQERTQERAAVVAKVRVVTRRNGARARGGAQGVEAARVCTEKLKAKLRAEAERLKLEAGVAEPRLRVNATHKDNPCGPLRIQ